jgi:NADPH:quinone reductase-like Zn-dependent oxidoreductase
MTSAKCAEQFATALSTRGVTIGGAGGVGSIAVQLVRKLTDLTVIATASRPQTQSWVRDLGAHYVIDHTKPLAEILQKRAEKEIAWAKRCRIDRNKKAAFAKSAAGK